MIDLLLIAGGLAGLFVGGDWLVKGASRLARSFGVSALIVGLTVVAFGTSMPELLVSFSAALRGSSDISIGNAFGSNISNIGLILGLTGLVLPVMVHVTLVRREIPIMIVVTIVCVALAFAGRSLSRVDGVLLLLAFAAFNVLMYRLTVIERQSGLLAVEEAQVDQTGMEPVIQPEQRKLEVLRLFVGLVVLMIGAQLTVEGAVNIARGLGVSELVIGVTLVAVGTSLPELATSLMAAIRKQNDIAIGNIVGSNIFNLLLILGATALVRPIAIAERVVNFDSFVMLAFSLALLPIAFNGRIGRGESALLLAGYVAFTVAAFIL